MVTETTSRIGWLDTLKALGVAAVVLFHSGPPSSVTILITPFFLGIFFFASGYTYKDENTLHPLKFLGKRLRSLYWPFVAWNLLYLSLHNVFMRMNILSDKAGYLAAVSHSYSIEEFLTTANGIVTLRSGTDMGGALWFLISLFTVNLVFCGVSCVTALLPKYASWTRLLAVSGLVVIGFTNQTVVTYPQYLNLSLVATSIFYSGYLYRRFESRIPINAYFAILAASIIFAGRGQTSLSPILQGGAIQTIVTCLAGIYLCLFAAKTLTNRWTEFVGRRSLFIIATHFLAFKLVSVAYVTLKHDATYIIAKFPVATTGGAWWVAYALCGLLAPLAAWVVIDRIGCFLGTNTESALAVPAE